MRWGLGCLALVASWGSLPAAEPQSVVQKITANINEQIRRDWSSHNVTPAPLADDGEYLRRVYLDLIGRTPRVAEARAFIEDPSPHKRSELVKRLLNNPAHAEHLAGMHRLEWLPQTATDPRAMFNGFRFEEWLQREYKANTPIDELARKLITAKVAIGQRGQLRPNNARGDNELDAFYTANDGKPEVLGSTISRVFLGIKLECAQCHDHPFAPYTRIQFWQFSAFFAEFTPLPPISPNFVGPLEPQYLVNRLVIPNTTREVVATHFDGMEPSWSPKVTPREELANWLTSPKNSYFARNWANRLWAHCFGLGLIDPVDEPGENNPPSHPELLDKLAEGLIEAKFDRRVMFEAIMASDVYQRTSRQTHASQSDPRRLGRMNIRNLSANQIFDSFATATGMRDDSPRQVAFVDFRDRDGRAAFRQQFPLLATKPTEGQTSILQALMMMNGNAMSNQTSLDRSEVLAAILDAPFLDTNKRIEALFLSTFTRKPTEQELEKYSSYVDRGGPSGDKKKALADVFWVLLNSPEFILNR